MNVRRRTATPLSKVHARRPRLGPVWRSIAWSLRRPTPGSIDEIRAEARRRLPRAIFDFVDGAAEDEVTLARNLHDFRAVELVPSALVDVSDVNPATNLFGIDAALPIALAPTGLTRLVHPDGELAVARAAARHRIPYVLSSMGSTSCETVGAETEFPKLFQLYVWRDRGRLKDLFDRARNAGFTGLELTIDVPVLGARERDRP